MGLDQYYGCMYCKKCGYDLHACRKRMCPECGRYFDRRDPPTYRQWPRGAMFRHRLRQMLGWLEWVVHSFVVATIVWFAWFALFPKYESHATFQVDPWLAPWAGTLVPVEEPKSFTEKTTYLIQDTKNRINDFASGRDEEEEDTTELSDNPERPPG